jgi:hypothetical protein
MTLSKSDIYVSPEVYLEGEKISPIKHEYSQGEIYAIATLGAPASLPNLLPLIQLSLEEAALRSLSTISLCLPCLNVLIFHTPCQSNPLRG